MNTIVSIALVAVAVVTTLFISRPDLMSFTQPAASQGQQTTNPFQKVFVSALVDEEITLAAGEEEAYGINTANSRAINLKIHPNNPDDQLNVHVFYLAEQNKTFDGMEQLSFYANYYEPLEVDINPDQDSKVVVKLEALADSDVKVQINLRYLG